MFPELSGSYKVVLGMQVLASYILVAVIWYNFGVMWGAVAFALDTLKDCFVVTALIGVSRANAISEEAQRRMLEQRNKFGVVEGRLLNRAEMEQRPPTLELPGADQDNWNN